MHSYYSGKRLSKLVSHSLPFWNGFAQILFFLHFHSKWGQRLNTCLTTYSNHDLFPMPKAFTESKGSKFVLCGHSLRWNFQRVCAAATKCELSLKKIKTFLNNDSVECFSLPKDVLKNVSAEGFWGISERSAGPENMWGNPRAIIFL